MLEMELKDKTILVTGSSSGIGQAIAIEAAKKGAKIIVHFRKNKAGAEKTLTEINKYSSGQIVQADLTNDNEVTEMFKDIKDIDILVNNAGKYAGGKPDDYAVWQQQYENIFMSMVRVTNNFLKLKSESGIQKIVNISSIYGLNNMENEGSPAFNAAKASIISFTLTLAKKYAPQILVNCITPGYTWTPLWGEMSADEKKPFEEQSRIGRFVKPEEIANAVMFLLENDAMTGEVIRVDGGVHLQKLA